MVSNFLFKHEAAEVKSKKAAAAKKLSALERTTQEGEALLKVWNYIHKLLEWFCIM